MIIFSGCLCRVVWAKTFGNTFCRTLCGKAVCSMLWTRQTNGVVMFILEPACQMLLCLFVFIFCNELRCNESILERTRAAIYSSAAALASTFSRKNNLKDKDYLFRFMESCFILNYCNCKW